MADETPTPQARADVDPVFRNQLEAIAKACAKFAAFVKEGGQPEWMMPDQMGGWNGDLNDWDGMARAFNSDKSDQWYADATNDANAPGTTGDMVVTTLQIDELAVMRRAFLARHAYDRRRCLTLMAGRMDGLGHQQGVFRDSLVEYINRLVRLSKGADT